MDGFAITAADGARGLHWDEAVGVAVEALMKIQLIAQANSLPWQRVLDAEDEVVAGILPILPLSGVVSEVIARLDEVPPLAD